jgi:hypothetical protein
VASITQAMPEELSRDNRDAVMGPPGVTVETHSRHLGIHNDNSYSSCMALQNVMHAGWVNFHMRVRLMARLRLTSLAIAGQICAHGFAAGPGLALLGKEGVW